MVLKVLKLALNWANDSPATIVVGERVAIAAAAAVEAVAAAVVAAVDAVADAGAARSHGGCRCDWLRNSWKKAYDMDSFEIILVSANLRLFR